MRLLCHHGNRAGGFGAAMGGAEPRVQIVDGQGRSTTLEQMGRVAALAACSDQWLASADGHMLRLWALAT